MNDELPDHLRPTRDLLLQSVKGQATEDPPPPPPGLLDDLEGRLGGRAPAAAPERPQASLVERLRSFFATPAFGLVAAAVLVLGIAIPMRTGPESGPETFRGGADGDEPAVRVVLIGSSDEGTRVLESSGLLDAAASATVATPDDATGQPNPKVVIDFNEGTITIHADDGRTIDQRGLPDDLGELPRVLAEAVEQASGE